MPTQKTQILLLAVVVIAVVALSFWLMIGFDRMTAQAQSNLSLLSQEPKKNDMMIAYQGVHTETLNFLEDFTIQEGQVEVIDDLQSAIAKIGAGSKGLSAQSLNAGYEYIPPSAFRHDGFSPASGYKFFPTGGFIQNDSSSQMCLAAPVYVPHGATFTSFLTFFIDNSASSDLTIFLVRQNHATPGGTAETVVGVTFPEVDDSVLKVGFLDPFQTQPGTGTVSNDYGYSVVYCFDPNTGTEQLVYGFIVIYS